MRQVIVRHVLDLPKIPYTATTKRNAVELELTIYEVDHTKLDIDLSPCPSCKSISIMGSIWNAVHSDCSCAGQIYATIASYASYFGELEARVRRIIQIWKRWHLSSIRPGTRGQEMYLAGVYDTLAKHNICVKRDYGEARTILENVGLLVDRGHRYGSSWLAEPVPELVINELVHLFTRGKDGHEES